MAEVIRDSLLLVNANNGFETFSIGINNPPALLVQTYQLTSDPFQNGVYKNSTSSDDYYQTNSIKPGQLVIEQLDEANTIIKASFSFTAYHSYRENDSVNVVGNFRLKYHKY